jgi:hypothetical protein
VGCLLGELSGNLFLLTDQERRQWEEEKRKALEQCKQDVAKEHDTEQLSIIVLQEA